MSHDWWLDEFLIVEEAFMEMGVKETTVVEEVIT